MVLRQQVQIDIYPVLHSAYHFASKFVQHVPIQRHSTSNTSGTRMLRPILHGWCAQQIPPYTPYMIEALTSQITETTLATNSYKCFCDHHLGPHLRTDMPLSTFTLK